MSLVQSPQRTDRDIYSHGDVRYDGAGQTRGGAHCPGCVRHSGGARAGVRADHRQVRVRVSGRCGAQSGAGPGAAGDPGEPRGRGAGGRGAAEGAGEAAAGEERPIRAGEEAPGESIFLQARGGQLAARGPHAAPINPHRGPQELELVEDVWRGEVQDLLSQITQLQAENKKLLVSLSLKESPITEEDLQRHEGMSEKERQMMKKLKDLVDKQRDEIRAKDHELTLKNEDVEALQMQQHRLIRINQDLRHRKGVMEAQGKALIQQRAELEAAAQVRQQELGALQVEVKRLRKELRGWELEREVADIEETSFGRSMVSTSTSPQRTSSAAVPVNSIKPNSVWEECGGDPDFMANSFEHKRSSSPLTESSREEKNYKERNREEDKTAAMLLQKVSTDPEPEEETDSSEEDSDKPRFTLQELRDVLQERNELKAEVFVLQEELAYYKSEEIEDDVSSWVCPPSPPPFSGSTDQPESGIKRLIFTAIMPMVAAGLIVDDPTLIPIRRLVSFV